jgi:hypothetical protein
MTEETLNEGESKQLFRADSEHEMVAVEDLCEGDLVDLEGDPYADASGENARLLRESYQRVHGVEQETSECVVVGFDFDAVGFPAGHLVRRQRTETQALEFFGLRITLIEGDDGYPVVRIDSSDETPKQTDHGVPMLRVYVNDCLVSNDTPKHGGKIGQW